MTKITIVGAGNVGAQAAFYAGLKNLGDIVLIDIIEGMPQGKALDMLQSMPIAGSDAKLIGTNDYADTKESDIVVITAGLPRKPGMSRDDLVEVNAKIMRSIVPEVVKYSPNCMLIVLSNPLDAMVQLAYNISGFPKNRVVGMAGVLDTCRFKTFIAQAANAPVKDVEAMVLGGHGDSMVPVVGMCKVNGKPVTEVLPAEKVDEIVKRTQNGGAEIVGLLKTGSAFFAPGLSVIEMAESILKDQKKVLPCAALLEGEYGVNGIFVGVPVKLGKDGVEEVIELELTDKEKELFQKSVDNVKDLIANL